MLRYQLENKTNQWKELLLSTNEENKDNVIEKLAIQLLIDDAAEVVSDCALYAPRMKSAIDLKLGLASELAMRLFPLDGVKDPVVERIWSYIRYSKMISKLTKKFKDQIETAEKERTKFKEIRKTSQRVNFCTLKTNPISDLIVNPVPMPVEIAHIGDLEPFFDNLTQNKETKVLELRFKRGVQYNDGRMDLCKQVVGPPHIGKLMDSLKGNQYIEHFLLGNNIIGLNGATAIAEFLESGCSKIKTWYLAGNEICSKGIEMIADQLKNDKYCEALWLKRNPIKINGSKSLNDMLVVNCYIKILDLHNCGLLDEGAKNLFNGLEKNNVLRQLYLTANGITVDGTAYIASYFDRLKQSKIKGITSLWLDINRLDDDGAVVLSDALRDYYYLRRLYLGSNRIGLTGTERICQNLMDHPNILVLDLGLYKSTADLSELPNNMCDEGAQFVAEFISKNRSVEIVSILHNNVTMLGLEVIKQAVYKSSNIMYAYHEQYGLDIPHGFKQSMRQHLEANIQNKYGMGYVDFVKTKLRYMKGSPKLHNIDSVYRNKM